MSVEIKQGSKPSIAAACFSIYAFQELKEQLSQIEELRFIFTSPTFVTEKAKKERREFYIPRLNVMSGAKGTKMPRGDKTHIMLYPIPRFSETQLLKFIEYNKISFGEGGRMRSLSRVSRKQRYSTLDFPAENRVPTGMQNSPESIKAFAVFDGWIVLKKMWHL